LGNKFSELLNLKQNNHTRKLNFNPGVSFPEFVFVCGKFLGFLEGYTVLNEGNSDIKSIMCSFTISPLSRPFAASTKIPGE